MSYFAANAIKNAVVISIDIRFNEVMSDRDVFLTDQAVRIRVVSITMKSPSECSTSLGELVDGV